MNYIYRSYRRATLYQIQNFILHGGEAKRDPPESYFEEGERVFTNIEKRLHQEISDPRTVDQILSEINGYTSIEQEHSMLLGMQFGASLLEELLSNTNKII